MKWVGSSSLQLQMWQANRAISNVASAAKTFQCWRMADIKSWDTFRMSNILAVTSDWDWKHLVGGSWNLSETPSLRVSWSAKRSAFFEALWSFGIWSIFSLIIWLWTILEPRMRRCQSLPRYRHWLKCCDWAAPTSWFTNCVANSRDQHWRDMVSRRGVGW